MGRDRVLKRPNIDLIMKSPLSRAFRALIWLCIAYDSIARNIDPNEIFNSEESILGLEMIDSQNPTSTELEALYSTIPPGYIIEILGTQQIGIGRRHRREDEYAFLYEDVENAEGSNKKKDKKAKKEAKKNKKEKKKQKNNPTTTSTTSTTTTTTTT